MQMAEHQNAKPFYFQGLKKLSSKIIQIEQALLNYLPFEFQEENLKVKLKAFLDKQFREDCKIQLEKIVEGNTKQFFSALPSRFLVAQIAATPLESKAWLQIDYTLALKLIHKLLGSQEEMTSEIRALTPLEMGIQEFIILKALSIFYQVLGQDAVVQFRLEKIQENPQDLVSFSKQETPLVLLYYLIQAGSYSGYVTLALPHPLIEGLFLKEMHYPEEVERKHQQQLVDKLFNVSFVKTNIVAELGSVSLTIAEKNQLEKGDVVLFDQTFCQFTDGHLSGRVLLKAGEHGEQGFLAQLVSADSPLLVKVIDYYGGDNV